MIPGRNTASIADPTLPALRPPTNPAIKPPSTGSQNNRMEITNIHTIAEPILPFFAVLKSHLRLQHIRFSTEKGRELSTANFQTVNR